MKIIKGKHTGRPARVRQFANDWIGVDFTDETGGHAIVRPDQVQLENEEERERFADTEKRLAGAFGRMWQLRPDGTFARRPVAPAPSAEAR